MTCPACFEREAPPGEILCHACFVDAAKSDPHPLPVASMRVIEVEWTPLMSIALDFDLAVTRLGIPERWGRP